jgi:IS30 family transposase
MRQYKPLTEENHIEICAMKQAGKQQKLVAGDLRVHPNTISRKLARNRSEM